MSVEEIKSFISTQILQSLDGYMVETNKLDFKRQWYDFKNEDGLNEFLKDSTSIINSYGGGHGFLVIGYDEKTRNFYESPFSHSGFKNDSDLLGIVKRKVDRPFNLQVIDHIFVTQEFHHKISIIHLLPSLDKPHVIRQFTKGGAQYLNEIFIRKDKNCERASKADLDLMYAERPSLLTDRKAIFTFKTTRTRFYPNHDEKAFFLTSNIAIENGGFKAFAINSIQVKILNNAPFRDLQVFTMQFHSLIENYGHFPIIRPDEIYRFSATFRYGVSLHREDADLFIQYLNQGVIEKTTKFDEVRLILSNGDFLLPQITMVDH
jgi:hypothetical protein